MSSLIAAVASQVLNSAPVLLRLDDRLTRLIKKVE
jgi:hypothetical protein